ncbi:mitochondrial ribosomal protein L10 [Brevipalpus obovatus]|uniref:mitochondrial ribosomal protein L10 n=1 Tax=Brevipalpus obovatus TaxID=246614 RepID=UPI003D9DE801
MPLLNHFQGKSELFSLLSGTRSKWKPFGGSNQVRYKKINERLRQEPTYDKKLLLAACEPIPFPKSSLPTSVTCSNLRKIDNPPVHPYVQVLADEYTEYLTRSTLVAFYHVQPVEYRTWRACYNFLFNKGFIMKKYDQEVADVALKSTKWQPLLKFYQRSAETHIVFGDSFDVKPLFAAEKKFPNFVLMFAVADDRILRRDEVESLMGNTRDMVNAQLVHLLSNPGSSISSSISHHSQQISQILHQHSSSDSTKSSDPPKSADGVSET